MILEGLPEEIATRLGKIMPWWQLMDCPDLSGTQLITKEANSFAQRLSKYQVAVVPDPRIDAGGIKGDTLCKAIILPKCLRQVSQAYSTAQQQIDRDLAFLSIKGKATAKELNWVQNKGLDAFNLDAESRARLRVWIDLRLQDPSPNAIELVQAPKAADAMYWLVDAYSRYRAMCEADGPLNALEEDALKLSMQTAGTSPGTARRQLSIFDEPMPMLSSNAAPTREAPLKVASRTRVTPQPQLVLNPKLIEHISTQTQAVAQLLSTVFEDNVSLIEASSSVVTGPTALNIVAQQSQWVLAELLAQLAQAGFMPEATLDALNDQALDACNELLLEGDSLLDVNKDVLADLSSSSGQKASVH